MRFGLWTVPTTRTVCGFLEHFRSSSSDTVSTTLKFQQESSIVCACSRAWPRGALATRFAHWRVHTSSQRSAGLSRRLSRWCLRLEHHSPTHSQNPTQSPCSFFKRNTSCVRFLSVSDLAPIKRVFWKATVGVTRWSSRDLSSRRHRLLSRESIRDFHQIAKRRRESPIASCAPQNPAASPPPTRPQPGMGKKRVHFKG